MKLGVDIFSLRFNDWNAFEHLDYASRIGLDVVHFSDLEPFDRLDDEYLKKVKARADELGLAIEVGMGSICPTSVTFSDTDGSATGDAEEQLRRMIHIASIMDSPAVRCYLGSNADRTGEIPFSVHIENTIATCRAVREMSLDLGVKIAIENHAGDMQGSELRALIESAGTEFVGACIDAGNPLWVAESPFVTLEHLAPYVVMSHVRDAAVWRHPRGAVAQWTAMGEGNVGIEAWTRRYQELCPNTHFTLEIITSLPPNVLNYLEPEFWRTYPDTPAHEFAQFVALVEAGAPYTQPLLTANWSDLTSETRVALAAQQRQKLEQSVRFCREVLGI